MLYGNEITPHLTMYFERLNDKLFLFINLTAGMDSNYASSHITLDIQDAAETMQAMQTLAESLRSFIPGATPID